VLTLLAKEASLQMRGWLSLVALAVLVTGSVPAEAMPFEQVLARTTFCEMQKVAVSGIVQPGAPEENLSAAVTLLTASAQSDYGQNISSDEAKNLLQQAKADYQSGSLRLTIAIATATR
jgi:hypothetical protein